MFLPREKKILDLLYKQEKPLTATEIANRLDVSPRTIKSDIKKINDELLKKGCSIDSKAGVGLWLSYNKANNMYLQKLLYGSNEEVSQMILEIRKYHIAIKLFQKADYVSMESISEELFVSKGTVLNDLLELDSFFERYNIAIVKKTKYGIQIQGEELQIRSAEAATLKEIIKIGKEDKGKCLKRIFLEEVVIKIYKVIKQLEKKFLFKLAETSYFDLTAQLAMTVDRVKNGHICQVPKQWIDMAEKSDACQEIICEMRKDIETEFGMSLPQQDLIYLVKLFAVSKMQMSEGSLWRTIKADGYNQTPNLMNTMMSILGETGQVYNINLTGDETLISVLEVHLESMIQRVQENLQIENPTLDYVRKKMVFEYEVAAFIANGLGKQYEIKIPEEEIGHLAFFVAASIERIMQDRKKQKIRVMLVCSTGIGTSQFIMARLTRIFPDMDIIDVMSASKAKEDLKPDTQEVIISTVPLSMEGIEVIYVSPILDHDDIRQIREQMHIHNKENSESIIQYALVNSLLNRDISIFKCDCRSREEVIQLMGTRMVGERYADEGYIDSVLKREKLTATAIGKLIAIPHSFEGHVMKPGIGLMTLQKPIKWGPEKVQIILMLALDSKSKSILKEVFSEVVDIMSNPLVVRNILSATKFSELEFIK